MKTEVLREVRLVSILYADMCTWSNMRMNSIERNVALLRVHFNVSSAREGANSIQYRYWVRYQCNSWIGSF